MSSVCSILTTGVVTSIAVSKVLILSVVDGLGGFLNGSQIIPSGLLSILREVRLTGFRFSFRVTALLPGKGNIRQATVFLDGSQIVPRGLLGVLREVRLTGFRFSFRVTALLPGKGDLPQALLPGKGDLPQATVIVFGFRFLVFVAGLT